MRSLWLALAALLGVGNIALADGVTQRAGDRCCGSPTWSGVYAGFQAGGAWGDTGWSFPFVESFNTAAGQHFSTKPEGGLGGVQVGINQQMGSLLFGGELSFAGASLHQTVTGATGLSEDRFKTLITNIFTATGRAGVVFDKHLVYGKAGYANANVDLSAISGPPIPGISADERHRQNGWTAGAGWEYRIGRSLVFGVEYDYIDLGSSRFSTTTQGAVSGAPFNVDLDNTHIHTLTARLSILLDRGPTASTSLK